MRFLRYFPVTFLISSLCLIIIVDGDVSGIHEPMTETALLALNSSIHDLISKLKVYQLYIGNGFENLHHQNKQVFPIHPNDFKETPAQLPDPKPLESPPLAKPEKHVEESDSDSEEESPDLVIQPESSGKKSSNGDPNTKSSSPIGPKSKARPSLHPVQVDSYEEDEYVDLVLDREDIQNTAGKKHPKICGVVNTAPGRSGEHRNLRGQTQWPWIVALGSIDEDGIFELKCGGTLVDTLVVIATAACARRGLTTVQLLGGTVTTAIDWIEYHPDYNEDFGYFDVSLLKLSDYSDPKEEIVPVCLPPVPTRSQTRGNSGSARFDSESEEAHLTQEGKLCYSVEWTQRRTFGFPVSSMQSTFSKVIDNQECNDRYTSELGGRFWKIFPKGVDSSLLCVKALRRNVCQNSVVSLFSWSSRNHNVSFMIAVQKEGESTCTQGGGASLPAIYTAIQPCLSWIWKLISFVAGPSRFAN